MSKKWEKLCFKTTSFLPRLLDRPWYHVIMSIVLGRSTAPQLALTPTLYALTSRYEAGKKTTTVSVQNIKIHLAFHASLSWLTATCFWFIFSLITHLTLEGYSRNTKISVMGVQKLWKLLKCEIIVSLIVNLSLHKHCCSKNEFLIVN